MIKWHNKPPVLWLFKNLDIYYIDICEQTHVTQVIDLYQVSYIISGYYLILLPDIRLIAWY